MIFEIDSWDFFFKKIYPFSRKWVKEAGSTKTGWEPPNSGPVGKPHSGTSKSPKRAVCAGPGSGLESRPCPPNEGTHLKASGSTQKKWAHPQPGCWMRPPGLLSPGGAQRAGLRQGGRGHDAVPRSLEAHGVVVRLGGGDRQSQKRVVCSPLMTHHRVTLKKMKYVELRKKKAEDFFKKIEN